MLGIGVRPAAAVADILDRFLRLFRAAGRAVVPAVEASALYAVPAVKNETLGIDLCLRVGYGGLGGRLVRNSGGDGDGGGSRYLRGSGLENTGSLFGAKAFFFLFVLVFLTELYFLAGNDDQ